MHGGHQEVAAAEEAAEQTQKYPFGAQGKGNVCSDCHKQKHQGEHQRGVGDFEETVGLLVGNGSDCDKHGQPEYSAQGLPGGGEEIADGEGHP